MEEVAKTNNVPETLATKEMDTSAAVVEELVTKDTAPIEESKKEEGVEVEKMEPSFVVLLQDEQVTEGEGVKLKAQASGVPKPEFVWFKDEKQIKLNDRVKAYEEDNFAVLEITETELEDEADYICIAKNEVGEVESAAELLVDGELGFLLAVLICKRFDAFFHL